MVAFWFNMNRWFKWLENKISQKLKASTKEYIKVNGKMTNKFMMKHYTPSEASTEELLKLYESALSSYKRKKEMIRKELVKRGKLPKHYNSLILYLYLYVCIYSRKYRKHFENGIFQ